MLAYDGKFYYKIGDFYATYINFPVRLKYLVQQTSVNG